MEKKLLVTLALVWSLLELAAVADTVILKDGRKIIGDVVQVTDDAVVISKQNGSFIYSIDKDRVEEVRESTPGEARRRQIEEERFYQVDKKKIKERQELLKKYRLEKYGKAKKVTFIDGKPGVVEATLNDKVKALLLVDTGASLVLISKTIAEELGVYKDIEGEKITVILADGSETTAIPVVLDSVEVAEKRVENVEAAISERPPAPDIDGLLGTPYLRHFHVKLDSEGNYLILEED